MDEGQVGAQGCDMEDTQLVTYSAWVTMVQGIGISGNESFARTANEHCYEAYSIQCHRESRHALSFIAPTCEKVSAHLQ